MLFLENQYSTSPRSSSEGWMAVFGARLKEARLRRNLTQTEVGVKAGFDHDVAATRISQYERGIHIPPVGVAEHLAKAVDVPTAYFYASDEQLAAWILAFPKISIATRRSIIEKAGTMPRK